MKYYTMTLSDTYQNQHDSFIFGLVQERMCLGDGNEEDIYSRLLDAIYRSVP